MTDDRQPRAARLLTVAVLALNGVWLVMLAGGAVVMSSDAAFTMEMWVLTLYPGCAFVPALYYLMRGRRATDPKKARHFTGMAAMLTLMGVVVLGSTVYSFVRIYPR